MGLDVKDVRCLRRAEGGLDAGLGPRDALFKSGEPAVRLAGLEPCRPARLLRFFSLDKVGAAQRGKALLPDDDGVLEDDDEEFFCDAAERATPGNCNTLAEPVLWW